MTVSSGISTLNHRCLDKGGEGARARFSLPEARASRARHLRREPQPAPPEPGPAPDERFAGNPDIGGRCCRLWLQGNRRLRLWRKGTQRECQFLGLFGRLRLDDRFGRDRLRGRDGSHPCRRLSRHFLGPKQALQSPGPGRVVSPSGSRLFSACPCRPLNSLSNRGISRAWLTRPSNCLARFSAAGRPHVAAAVFAIG